MLYRTCHPFLQSYKSSLFSFSSSSPRPHFSLFSTYAQIQSFTPTSSLSTKTPTLQLKMMFAKSSLVAAVSVLAFYALPAAAVDSITVTSGGSFSETCDAWSSACLSFVPISLDEHHRH